MNVKLYIVDSTLPTVSKANQIKQFDSYKEFVNYLEQISIRRFNQTRRQRMIMLEELGHTSDDNTAVTFVRSFNEVLNMGIIRDDKLVQCDVPSVVFYQKEEFGD